MKKFILFLTAAALSSGAFASFASDPVQKDGFFDKAKKKLKTIVKRLKTEPLLPMIRPKMVQPAFIIRQKTAQSKPMTR